MKWQPIRWREVTDEEREFHPDWTRITDDPLPNHGENVLVCVGYQDCQTYEVEIDSWDDDYGEWTKSDIESVVAWMPLPEPYAKNKTE